KIPQTENTRETFPRQHPRQRTDSSVDLPAPYEITINMLIRLIFLSFLLMGKAYADNQTRYSLGVGAFANTGDYDSEADAPATRMQFLPVTFKLQQGNWTARLQTAWVKISGPGNLGEGIRVATDRHAATGLGDTVLGLDWRHLGGRWLVEPGMRIKLPSADEDKGLGTGSRDYSAQLAAMALLQTWRPFAQLGYKWRGHSDLIELRNGAFGNLGLDHAFSNRFSTGVGYDWRRASTAQQPPGRELFLYASWQSAKSWKQMLYFAKGFSDTSADKTIGIQISHNW
ncbi:MAG TPA: hypothetical protein VFM46_02530, partial [Pseudomonadales bacterium]|nr:hypothetical protein [Pseudomonadales bacterium]